MWKKEARGVNIRYKGRRGQLIRITEGRIRIGEERFELSIVN